MTALRQAQGPELKMMTSNTNKKRSVINAGIFALSLLVCIGFTIRETPNYPQGYFSLPVNRAIQLSGTFGELRTNHFHAGLDIKSKDGSIGESLLAAAPGFISRISVQGSGYGNAVYVDHPNGYTTVYGHMDHFPANVQSYIKDMQYAQERFAVELYPKPNQFAYDKGEVVGYLGNSGGSTGPHVHFEIRKTADQLPINPLLFGLSLEDKSFPGMRSLKVYHLDQELYHTHDEEHPIVSVGPGQYRLNDTLTENALQVGFALKVYDQMAGASNQNGIYGLNVSVDDMPEYSFALNSIPFSLTRYLNAHIDYAARRYTGGFYHRCFKLPGNALEIYEEENERGIVQLFTDKTRKVEIKAFDAGGNVASLVFYIKQGSTLDPPENPVYDHAIDYMQSAQINSPELMVSFDPHTFYQNTRLAVTKLEIMTPGCFAPAHEILPLDIPVHRYYDMTILSNGLPETLKSKAFVARISEEGDLINCGGEVHGEYLYARVRSLGTFSVAVDTLAPEIIPLTFKENMQGITKMQFRIGDSQSIEGLANGLSYTATVDGKWILMEYDSKTSRLTHWFDEHIQSGVHDFVLRVSDDRGNVNTFVRRFSR